MEIQGQLKLQSINSFIHNTETLDYFLRNVTLPNQCVNGQKNLKNYSSAINSSVNMHKIKVFKIWRSFIVRLNEQQFGITTFHLQFLKFAERFCLQKQVIQIISQPGLPQLIDQHDYKQYLKLLVKFFVQMNDYERVYHLLVQMQEIQAKGLNESLQILQQLTLIKKIIGYQADKLNYNQSFEKIVNMHSQQFLFLGKQGLQKTDQMKFQLNLFISICQCQNLNQKQLNFLKDKGLMKLYNKGKQKRIIQLKKQLKEQVKMECFYRKKCNKIKNIEISDFSVIKQLNNPQIIYKYDKRNDIMYFNHQLSSEQQMNKLLSRTLQMQKIIKKSNSSLAESLKGRYKKD